MNEERIEMLGNYIEFASSPILLEDIPAKVFENAVILEANCDVSLLNGHYEGTEFVGPNWYNELLKTSTISHPILVISNLNQISKEEQTKFIEILKYKKISVFDLPKNCTIIVTASNLKEKSINEEVYSLLAHI